MKEPEMSPVAPKSGDVICKNCEGPLYPGKMVFLINNKCSICGKPYESQIATRHFEKIYDHAILPTRATAHSAGYDLYSLDDCTFGPGQVLALKTGIKVYMPAHEFLLVALRSSMVKKQFMLANGVGIIDADYVDNTDNEGEILVPLIYGGLHPFTIKRGDKIAQGIFLNYYLTEGDSFTGQKRVGGYGSTGE